MNMDDKKIDELINKALQEDFPVDWKSRSTPGLPRKKRRPVH
jgi:hypothetical protein